MKISLVLPSRGRPNRLLDCMRGFRSAAASRCDIEFCVRLDSCDPLLDRYMLVMNGTPECDVLYVVGRRMQGYASNHTMINEAARLATGDVLMQIVDDVIPRTWHWDEIYRCTIEGTKLPVWVASAIVHGSSDYPWSFPMIPRKLYEMCGSFALGDNGSVDRCWHAFADALECELKVQVEYFHDEIRGSDNQDQTAIDSIPFYEELQKDWKERSAEFKRIGREYAEMVRRKLA
jgi:hypothetical protein